MYYNTVQQHVSKTLSNNFIDNTKQMSLSNTCINSLYQAYVANAVVSNMYHTHLSITFIKTFYHQLVSKPFINTCNKHIWQQPLSKTYGVRYCEVEPVFLNRFIVLSGTHTQTRNKHTHTHTPHTQFLLTRPRLYQSGDYMSMIDNMSIGAMRYIPKRS